MFLRVSAVLLLVSAVAFAARPNFRKDVLSNNKRNPSSSEQSSSLGLPEYCIFTDSATNKSVDLGRVPTAYLHLTQHDKISGDTAPYDFVINLCRVNEWAFKIFTAGCSRTGLVQQYQPITDTCMAVLNSNPQVVPPSYSFNSKGDLTVALQDTVTGTSGTMTVKCGSAINLYADKYTYDSSAKTFEFEFYTSAACLTEPLDVDPDYAAFPPLWPNPKAYTYGLSDATISPNFKLTTNVPSSNTDFRGAMSRFSERTFEHDLPDSTTTTTTVLEVNVTNVDVPLQHGVDESYTLKISATGDHVHIQSNTLYGYYYALESLSQLIGFDFDRQAYVVRHAPWTVDDEPRFPHRGLLMDTARHYLPLRTIKTYIDSLTYAKLNVLHWHLVDAQSFPFMSPTYPQLAKLGAWSSQERFTANDVKQVVEYARQRGVRVMVEFDTPGHSASLCMAFPDICPSPPCKSSNINNWALDFTQNKTYEVIDAVWNDLAKLYPEQLMHLGGDEVDYWCWEQHPKIQKWLSDRNMSDKEGYLYYIKKIEKTVWDLPGNREVVGWEEIWNHFGTQLDNKTIIQQWLPNSVTLPKNVTSHGYRLIWSDSSKWYFDHLEVTWNQAYDAEPCNGLTTDECSRILGGEGCQWGETVDTSDAMQTIWPRLAAVAERLWTPRTVATHSSLAYRRLVGFRCLLNRRGIPAAPVNNMQGREAPPNPGSCYWQ